MKTLLDTTRVGGMALKNRFVAAAVGDFVAAGGHVTTRMREKYETLARGGAGTIISGFTLVDEAEGAFPIAAMYADAFIEEYRGLTASVHAQGARMLQQLVYIGSYVMGETGGRPVLGPSAMANLNNGVVPKAMTGGEIRAVQGKFAQAAVRAKQAGFDGVELHAAHGFLLSQFLTPYYNRRSDGYGGSAGKRARMVLETLAAVREAAGADFPVWVKLNCTDGIEGGIAPEDFRQVCAALGQAGAAAIEVSGNWLDRAADKGPYFREEAATIAGETAAAVVLTGGNRDFAQLEELLNRTGIGYFGLARPLIAEPDLPLRYERERPERARCVSCNACAQLENAGSCILTRGA